MKVKISYDNVLYNNFNKIRLIQNTSGVEMLFSFLHDDETVFDLNDFDLVTLELKDVISNEKKSISLIPVDAVNGVMKWFINPVDTDLVGVFDTEITFNSTLNNVHNHMNVSLLTITNDI